MEAWTFSQTVPCADPTEDSEPNTPTIGAPFGLAEVKALFLGRHYKKCASQCTALLMQHTQPNHPLQATYLNFYAALSHDALARGMPIFSAARQSALALAEKHYLDAEKYLPDPIFFSSLDRQGHVRSIDGQTVSQMASFRDSILSFQSVRGIHTRPTSILLASPEHSFADEAAEIYDSDHEESVRHPSPLKIMKQPPKEAGPLGTMSFRNSIALTEVSRYSFAAHMDPFAELLDPLSAALQKLKDGHSSYEVNAPVKFGREHDDADSDDGSDLESPATPTWSYPTDLHHHIRLYNDHLTNFRYMLLAHISALGRVVQQPQLPQTPGLNSPAFTISGPASGIVNTPSRPTSFMIRPKTPKSPLITPEEKYRLRKERMNAWAEAKEKGDKSFDADRYQELCRLALSELTTAC